MKVYDLVIIGAGSVGTPAAMAAAEKKLSVLVLDELPSPGQGNNKKAIGGVRATHSDFGKIQTCQRSIEVFSTWEEVHGDNIEWMSHGYSYPAYSENDEKKLKDLMEIQLSYGLGIRWVSPAEYADLVPGINLEGLRGATYSPGDGSASPLRAANAFYFRALALGVEFRFSEKVTGLLFDGDRVVAVSTDQSTYGCGHLLNASGNRAAEIGRLARMDLRVKPDMHEGAITEPVKRFFGPMVVDMRPGPLSANFYFYQNREGQVVFCITPEPQLWGTDNASTSVFFPQVSRRMVALYPRLANLRVRRAWRGQYPMTPDGFPVVGVGRDVPNLIHAVGMCGQGFMLGPGLGELISRMVTAETTGEDRRVLGDFDPYRDFSGTEAFK